MSLVGTCALILNVKNWGLNNVHDENGMVEF
jgi:hypothetical protein